jgi:hypothetical protein
MSILKSCEIDFSHPLIQAERIISINDVPLGTQGNLFGITGGEGTRKSNYVGSLIAGTICEASSSIDTLGTTVLLNTANKAVLLYDTEQSEVQEHFRRIKTRETECHTRMFQDILSHVHVA